MRIALLGPLEVTDDAGVPAVISGLRLRRLLARLAVDPGRLVTTQALVDAIWDEAPPAGAASALQSLVSRLRHSLPGGATILRAEPSGYRLRLPADAVDIARFERLSAQGREAAGRGDPATAAQCFTQALDLWRGPPFADLGPADFVVAAGVRLGELRLAAIEDHADAALTAGRAGEVIAEIAGLTAAHPLRERLWAVYMRALAAAGRSAEALAAFAELRDTLRRELGTDPSPALSRLHTAILRGEGGPHAPNAGPDPAPADGIRPVPAPGTGPAAQARAGAPRGNLRFALTSFVGREEELQQVIALLDQARLVTLVGQGGAGKTRLAVEVAARRAARLSDGHAGQIGADPPRPGPWPRRQRGRERSAHLAGPGTAAGRRPGRRPRRPHRGPGVGPGPARRGPRGVGRCRAG
jgi:DNA-binding SARP family transcriptional activator